MTLPVMPALLSVKDDLDIRQRLVFRAERQRLVGNVATVAWIAFRLHERRSRRRSRRGRSAI